MLPVLLILARMVYHRLRASSAANTGQDAVLCAGAYERVPFPLAEGGTTSFYAFKHIYEGLLEKHSSLCTVW